MPSSPALAKACPQPHLQLPDCILHHPRLEEGAGKGCSSNCRAGGRGQWRSPKTGSNLGASPGSTRRRLSTSSSRQGMGGKGLPGFAWRGPTRCMRRRLRWLRGALEADIWAELRYSSQTRTERRGSRTRAVETQAGRGVQGRTGTGRRQEGFGRNPRTDLGRAGAGGLTPPPPCPGSDGSSHRVPRAGRGRGRGRRRQRPSGRHGRRRAAGSS